MKLELSLKYDQVTFEVHCHVGKGNQTIKWLASLAAIRLKMDAPKRSIPPNLSPFPKAVYTEGLSFMHPEARINSLLSDADRVYIEFYHENLKCDTLGIPMLSNWSYITYCTSSRKREIRDKLIAELENESKRLDEARIKKAEEDLILKNKPRIKKMKKLLSQQLVDGGTIAVVMEDIWAKMTLSGALDSLLKAQEERDFIRSFFTTHYMDFSEIFKTFSGVNAQGSTSTLEYVEFNKFIYETGIFLSGQHSNMILKLFGDVNTTIHSELDQSGFFLSLIQIAIYRYITLAKRDLVTRGGKGQQFSREEMIPSPSKALELLYNEHLKPLLNTLPLSRSDAKDFLRSDDGMLLLFEHFEIISKMFCNYANLPYDANTIDDSVKTGVMTLKQFNQFASNDFLGASTSGTNNITLKNARQIFSVSQNDGILSKSDANDFGNTDATEDHQLEMSFPEFIEGLCRLCVLKYDTYEDQFKSVEHYLKKKKGSSSKKHETVPNDG